MKVCSKCKETKSFEMFSKDKFRKDGYLNQCKACRKAYREANKEKIKAYDEANKEKISEKRKAYREANKEKISEKRKAYREVNKEKIKAYREANKDKKKAYREVNKEKIAEYQKYYDEANKEKIAERRKVHYEANKEKLKAYREANKEKITEYKKAYYEVNKGKIAEYHKYYRESNKGKVAENGSRSRARKCNAIPKFLRNCEVEKQRLRDIYKLRQLISYATGIEHHVDHMVPLSKGGPHWSGNLQILTATENLTKNAKLCKTLKKNIKASLEIARKEYDDEDHSNRHRD